MPEPVHISIPLAIHMDRLAENFAKMREAIVESFTPAMRKVSRGLEVLLDTPSVKSLVAANDPVHVAGMEARYAVRVALDPAYATQEESDRLVRALLAGNRDTRWMTLPNRALVAAAVCRSLAVRGG